MQPDLGVKEKILSLIDEWQEAFTGPAAKYPQYHAAYRELRVLSCTLFLINNAHYIFSTSFYFTIKIPFSFRIFF